MTTFEQEIGKIRDSVAQNRADFESYNYHLTKMVAASLNNHPSDMNYHWAQIEIIKNRNGGMPPEKV